jgi:hypothetical protein
MNPNPGSQEAPGGSRGTCLARGVALLVQGMLVAWPQTAEAQRPRRSRGGAAAAAGSQDDPTSAETRGEGGNYAAFQLLREGQELLDSGEHDRGTKILE